ncbi:hypothetical protein BZG82_16055 [Salinivibrio sp. PR5]|nr:hypothetical protein BZG82_16055 [Salinivibrio sp. PR5]
MHGIMENYGDYCKVKRSLGSKKCVICFSGFGTKRGRFNFIRTFSTLHCNQIYLNTPHDNYYHKGIPGLGNDLNETIESIREIINSLTECVEVITFGCSMGGYGALVYGALLNVDKIIGLGPSIPLYSESWLGKKERDKHVDIFASLESIISSSKAKKVILHGDSTLSDILTHHRMKNYSNVIARNFYGCSHALAQIVSRKMSLSVFVSDLDCSMAHIDRVFSVVDFTNKDILALESFFEPSCRDGIKKSELDTFCLDNYHHTVKYCFAVSVCKYNETISIL